MDAVTLEARIRTTFKLAIAAAIALAILAFVWPLFFGRPDFEGISQWVREQNLAPGVHEHIALPFPHAHRADNGTIDVVVSPDGRITFLLKTHIGWKQNYEGYVYSTEPFGAGEFVRDYYGRTNINNREFGDPVVRRRVDERTYEVYFDLG
ncbi:MAG: hypothetical protein WD875_11685 [Pirellulales bacterium]